MPDISWKEWIEKLLSSVDIVRVINRNVPLVRKGRTWWGSCPFHHEKTPSFAVNEREQFYHCFGCGESGNAIGFVAKFESVERIEAIKILAAEAGMQLPQSDYNPDLKKIAEKKAKRDETVAINKEAALFYHSTLMKGGNRAFGYLKGRGIDENVMRKFALGYSPEFNSLVRHMSQKGISADKLKDAGLAETNSLGTYDAFGGRVIVPIINMLSEVVGFGGRSLEQDAFAKYKNTAASAVFDKSKILFGGNIVKKYKQKNAVDSVILCEGYMDVIALYKAGFVTAVASMGTSLTLEQAKLLKRLADTVYVSYDGDAAGQKATLRSLDILEAAGLTVKVMSLPEGTDPDDVINKSGREAYQKLMSEALPPIEYKLKLAEIGNNLLESGGKQRYAQAAVKIIARLDSPVMREEYLQKLRARTGYTYGSLAAELTGQLTPDGVKRILKEEEAVSDKFLKAAKYVFSAYMAGFGGADGAEEALYFLDDGLIRELFKRKTQNPDLRAAQLIEGVPEERTAEILTLLEHFEEEGFDEKIYVQRAKTCRRERLMREQKILTERLDAETVPDLRAEMLQNIQRLIAEIHKLK